FRSAADPAIMRAKHRKLLMNLGNALDALAGWEARASDLFKAAMDEGIACYQAAGIDSQTAEEEHTRRDGGVSLKPVAGQDRGGSSSWQSLARGTGSIETDYLNGEIVLLGRLHGVPTPVNAVLQRVANEAARAGRAAGSVPLAELEGLLR
ncbi:MAG: putative ketopantoate reductase PanE/ApbA family protein, partial [Actinomycetia bacterium]|nr:putative ketopantoate reductase PanE/ApbA family protein [Actinomycetes bacterium]